MRSAEAAEVLSTLRALGVQFVLDGPTFWVSAPVGVLTVKRRARVTDYHAELFRLLHSEARLQGRAFCGECLVEVKLLGERPGPGAAAQCCRCWRGDLSVARLLVLRQAAYGPSAGVPYGVN